MTDLADVIKAVEQMADNYEVQLSDKQGEIESLKEDIKRLENDLYETQAALDEQTLLVDQLHNEIKLKTLNYEIH